MILSDATWIQRFTSHAETADFPCRHVTSSYFFILPLSFYNNGFFSDFCLNGHILPVGEGYCVIYEEDHR